MGAWGIAAFDNDDASDWVYDLEKRGSPRSMRRWRMRRARPTSMRPTDVNAIAAGEVVAAARGRPVDGLREDIQQLAIFVGPDVTAGSRRPSAGCRRARARRIRGRRAVGRIGRGC